MRARPLILLGLCIVTAALPSVWWSIGAATAIVVGAHCVFGRGIVALARQFVRFRWIVLFTVVPQLVFVPIEAASANSARVLAAISIAELISSAVSASAVLDGVSRALRPFARWIDPDRIALMLALTITTVPVLARMLQSIREAQTARGLKPRAHRLVVPLLVAALKHADELGEALEARGVGAVSTSLREREPAATRRQARERGTREPQRVR